jgi:hypothetical protein
MKFRLLIRVFKPVVLIGLIVPSRSAKSKLSALGISFAQCPQLCLISDATTLAIIKVHLKSLLAEFSHLAYDFFRIPRLPQGELCSATVRSKIPFFQLLVKGFAADTVFTGNFSLGIAFTNFLA